MISIRELDKVLILSIGRWGHQAESAIVLHRPTLTAQVEQRLTPPGSQIPALGVVLSSPVPMALTADLSRDSFAWRHGDHLVFDTWEPHALAHRLNQDLSPPESWALSEDDKKRLMTGLAGAAGVSVDTKRHFLTDPEALNEQEEARNVLKKLDSIEARLRERRLSFVRPDFEAQVLAAVQWLELVRGLSGAEALPGTLTNVLRLQGHIRAMSAATRAHNHTTALVQARAALRLINGGRAPAWQVCSILETVAWLQAREQAQEFARQALSAWLELARWMQDKEQITKAQHRLNALSGRGFKAQDVFDTRGIVSCLERTRLVN